MRKKRQQFDYSLNYSRMKRKTYDNLLSSNVKIDGVIGNVGLVHLSLKSFVMLVNLSSLKNKKIVCYLLFYV